MLLNEDVVYDQYDPVAKLHYRTTSGSEAMKP